MCLICSLESIHALEGRERDSISNKKVLGELCIEGENRRCDSFLIFIRERMNVLCEMITKVFWVERRAVSNKESSLLIWFL